MARDQLLEHRLGPGLQREHGGPVQVIVVPDDLAQVDTQERGNLVVAGDPAEVGSQAVPGLLDGARATTYGPGCPVHAAQLVEDRSEEHTSELQSLMRSPYAVFCLKKKQLPSHTSSTPTHTI